MIKAMPRFYSQAFLNSTAAAGKRQRTNSISIDRQISAVMKNLDRVLVDYSKKDRQRITRKAAQKVAQQARRSPGFDDSKRPHFRRNGTKVTEYSPGNLRRSLQVIKLKKSPDAFVGPQFALSSVKKYGAKGQPVDGYYAAMLYGSALAFRSRVLVPAMQKARPAALAVLFKESDKAIAARGVRRGFKTA